MQGVGRIVWPGGQFIFPEVIVDVQRPLVVVFLVVSSFPLFVVSFVVALSFVYSCVFFGRFAWVV